MKNELILSALLALSVVSIEAMPHLLRRSNPQTQSLPAKPSGQPEILVPQASIPIDKVAGQPENSDAQPLIPIEQVAGQPEKSDDLIPELSPEIEIDPNPSQLPPEGISKLLKSPTSPRQSV